MKEWFSKKEDGSVLQYLCACSLLKPLLGYKQMEEQGIQRLRGEK